MILCFKAEATVPIEVRRRESGERVLIVHYYQPKNAVVGVSVNIDNGKLIGSFEAPYCPSITGCRSMVHFESSAETFLTDGLDLKQITFQLTQNGKEIWLDHLLLAPAMAVTPDIFKYDDSIDATPKFINKCAAKTNFKVDFSDGEEDTFCNDAVLSLSAKYNDGARECNCDPFGTESNSNNCAKFGGQCKCKSNIIGRQCTKCKTGYYGFPDCRKCECPSGNCDDVSGKCICPLNVEEGNCDTCVSGTFGFHPIFGCDECNCNRLGVNFGNLNCDKESGQCECRENTDGLQCQT
jgi:laminin, alpha 3/5